MQKFLCALMLLLISGCKLLQPVNELNSTCSTELVLDDDPCTQLTWVKYYQMSLQRSWDENKQIIEHLPDEPMAELQEVLLSQASDTPYNNRLRSLKNIERIKQELPSELGVLLFDLVYVTSHQILVQQSGLVLSERAEHKREQTIQSQQIQIEEISRQLQDNKKKLEKLMAIESALSGHNHVESRAKDG